MTLGGALIKFCIIYVYVCQWFEYLHRQILKKKQQKQTEIVGPWREPRVMIAWAYEDCPTMTSRSNLTGVGNCVDFSRNTISGEFVQPHFVKSLWDIQVDQSREEFIIECFTVDVMTYYTQNNWCRVPSGYTRLWPSTVSYLSLVFFFILTIPSWAIHSHKLVK